jgi:ABC-2 type transport system ATP-binding protein
LHKPDLIVLDEPTTGLDPQGIIEIRNLILRLKTEQNKTILLSSHQLSEIELIANRMVIINQGRSIVEGNVQELLNNEETVVRVEIDSSDKAIELVKSHLQILTIDRISTTVFEVVMVKNRVPELSKLFVEAGLQIQAIEPTRKLEDYFIKIIQS